MIWYSHVNEDNRVERGLLLQGEYDQVICVTGSGERALSLMDAGKLRLFHAIDINPEANYLLEFKLAALKRLEVNDYLLCCGLLGKRSMAYGTVIEEIVQGLSPECSDYWQQRMDLLLAGVAHCGHFERFLRRIRPLLRTVLGKSFEGCLERPYHSLRKFPLRRWNLLLRLFCHRWIYLLLGNRDSAFIAPDTQPRLIPKALNETLELDQAANSFMFHLIFNGDLCKLPREHLPPSIREEVLDAILLRLSDPGFVLKLHTGDLKTLIANWPDRDFSRTYFSVSDILSFTDFNYLLGFLELLKGEGIAVVFRSFLRHEVSQTQLMLLRGHVKSVTDVSHRDQTRMYKVYHVQI